MNLGISSNVGFRFNLSTDRTYVVSSLRLMTDSKSNQYSGPLICWSKVIPLKVKCFVWRATLDRIPVTEALILRGIIVQNINC